MGKFSECQTPFTKCWCEAVPARANNPHCQNAITNVSIDGLEFSLIMFALVIAYTYTKITNHEKNSGNHSK